VGTVQVPDSAGPGQPRVRHRWSGGLLQLLRCRGGIYALNTECGQVGGCGVGSPEEVWLKADLAAHPTACIGAYWHEPRFSSGTSHGSSTAVSTFYKDLYDAGAEFVVNGHEHNYERFLPQDVNGVYDPARGIQEFVVGSGGRSHYGFGTPLPNSVARNADTYGVIKLTLHPGSFDWQFIPEAGKTYADSGSATCH
jgi:hypothetical protein